jgi:hypothetical protein
MRMLWPWTVAAWKNVSSTHAGRMYLPVSKMDEKEGGMGANVSLRRRSLEVDCLVGGGVKDINNSDRVDVALVAIARQR